MDKYATDPAVIRVDSVWHHYGVRPVLRGVDLVVQRGELLCVMGPNGSGKSTLLSIIGGLIPPFAGRVLIDGTARRSSVDAERAIRQRMAYLPAEAWLPLNETCRAYLFAVGRLYRIAEARLFEHVDRLLELFDLERQAEQAMKTLSTGQKKKMALAGALVTEAELLVLDEPFSGGLDPPALHALQGLFERLAADRSVTLIVAVPVPELIEAIADRVALIKEGVVSHCGSVAELKQQAGLTPDVSFATAADKLLGSDIDGKLERYFDTNDPDGALR
ncbi:MAG: ABC transporter ATP-binding protein [Planctomycetota bacterium]